MKTYKLKNGISHDGNGLLNARITESYDPDTITKCILCVHLACKPRVQELMIVKTVHPSVEAAKKYFYRNYDGLRIADDRYSSEFYSPAVWAD